MIREDIIKDAVYELYKQAVIVLGNDVKKSLEDALKIEDNNLAKLNINAILKNIEVAEEKGIPMCQDTGLPVVFIKLGNVEVENLKHGVEEGIKKATKEIPIRPNIVDPLVRQDAICPGPGYGVECRFRLHHLPGHGLQLGFALSAVFIEGLLFIILTVTNLREAIVNSLPPSLRCAIGGGIGLYLAFIGLQNGGVIVSREAMLVMLGNITRYWESNLSAEVNTLSIPPGEYGGNTETQRN